MTLMIPFASGGWRDKALLVGARMEGKENKTCHFQPHGFFETQLCSRRHVLRAAGAISGVPYTAKLNAFSDHLQNHSRHAAKTYG